MSRESLDAQSCIGSMFLVMRLTAHQYAHLLTWLSTRHMAAHPAPGTPVIA